MISPSNGDEEHPDFYNAVYFNMFYQGISNLLPWNVLIFANRYFETRLASVPEAENFIYYFTLIFMTMKFIFLVSGISVTHRVQPDSQIIWSITGNAIVFALIGIVCGFDLLAPRAFYHVILILVLLGSLFSSFVEAGFLAILTFFPPKYTQSYLVGHGFAGVVGALLHILTAMGSASAVTSKFAEVYFGMVSLVIFGSLVLFYFLKRLSMFKYFYKKGESVVRAKREAERLEAATGISDQSQSSTKDILYQISDLLGTAILVTWLNIIVSPTLIVMTESTQNGQATESIMHKDFFHVFAFLLSSVFDLIGKTIPAFSIMAITRLPFLTLAVARILLLPLMLLGNIQIKHYKLPFEPLYANDAIFMALVAVKAITGGYLGTLCMMWSPMRVKQMDRSRAVMLMVYAIGTGLLAGAISSLILKTFIQSISSPVK